MAIAKAAISKGAIVSVFDERIALTPEQIQDAEVLQGVGAAVVTGWHGRLLDEDFDVLAASPGFRREHPAIRDALARVKKVVSEVEFAYWLSQAPIIAITGTNGKSTTTALAWQLLRAAGKEAILCGNISGSGFPEETLTEAAMNSTTNQVLVAEISSYQLEWIDSFRPRVATITNISQDHLDRHPSFEDYRNTKLRIFSQMGEGDIAVVNEYESTLPVDELLQAIPQGVEIRRFSSICSTALMHEQDGVTHSRTRRENGNIVLGGRRLDVGSLKIIGEHNLVNAMQAWELAAAILGSQIEAVTEPMVQALTEFSGLRHRMEFLGERSGVSVINNSMCTNPEAVIVSSSSLPNKQHILMGGNTKNLDFGSVREYLLQSGHAVYLYGEGSVPPSANSLAMQLAPLGTHFSSLDEAFSAATSAAKQGEVILLAPGCLSTYPFASFRERGEHFRTLAKEWTQG